MANIDVNLIIEFLRMIISIGLMLKDIVVSLAQWILSLLGFQAPEIVITVLMLFIVFVWGYITFTKTTGIFKKAGYIFIVVMVILIVIMLIGTSLGIIVNPITNTTTPLNITNTTMPNITIGSNITNVPI